MSVLLQAQLCTLNYFNGIQILTKGTKYVPLMLPPSSKEKYSLV